ncbi:MAG: PAS domain-containing protein [Ferrovibrio sp.]
MNPPFNIPPAPRPVFDSGWRVVRAAERGQDWHPQVRELLFYWMRKCSPEGQLPSRQLIDRTELAELLPHMWMLDVQRSPWRFRYRMAGAAFAASVGRTIGNDWYDEIRPLAWTANRTRLITTVRDGMPTWRRGAVPVEDDAFDFNGWSEVENLMLPLACDGITVDTVLGIAMPFRPIDLWEPAALAAQ